MNTLANIALVKRDGTDFSDLDADLDAERTAEAIASGEQPDDESKAVAAFYGASQAPAADTVICYKCKGSGRFRTGNPRFGALRDHGPCFTCGGSGSVSAAKAKAHNTRETNKTAKIRQEAEARTTWAAAHADVIDWITKNESWNGFASKMSNILGDGKSLTVGQVEAIRKIIAEKKARAEAAAAQAVTAAPQGHGLDLRHIPDGRYAVPNGDTRLKVRIEKPDAPSKWAGWVFVSDGAEYGQQRKYGRQAPGKNYSGMIEKELRAIAADPKAAAVAYGKLTGTCCLCGRKLENEASVEAGIGPICAEKAGW